MYSKELKSVACIGVSAYTFEQLQTQLGKTFRLTNFKSNNEFYVAASLHNQVFHAIISEGQLSGPNGIKLKQSLQNAGFGQIPFSIILEELEKVSIKKVMEAGIAEVFMQPISANRIGKKLQYLIDKPVVKTVQNILPVHDYTLPFSKRLFDIVFSGSLLLCLLPLFLLIALLLKLESKGPVFYYALRVGTGYKTFKFYKFRSMFVGADKKLSQLKHLNQYANTNKEVATPADKKCDNCTRLNINCTSAMYADNKMWCEKVYKENLVLNAGQAFVKIKNDPRVTRVGKFIRNTSMDELPQLWNVLKGDMSIVGNRPLPLYEAEKLTTDRYALRFIAPAGITGLWQVSKRGKGEMSEDERISLDNDYAKSFGLWFDIKLILRTIPALFQNENV